MRNFQRQRVWRNMMQSKPVLILLGVLMLFFAWSVLGFFNKMIETSRNKNIAEAKVSELEKRKAKLSSDIANLNTEAGKEKIFRENLGLAKEGEGEIVIVDDKNTVPVKEPDYRGFFYFFTKWFK